MALNLGIPGEGINSILNGLPGPPPPELPLSSLQAPSPAPTPNPSSWLPQPRGNKPLDWLEAAGSGIDPNSLGGPYIPKVAGAIGSFLSAFSNSRASHRALGYRQALETKLGVPLDFFLRLPKDAQQEILDKAGFSGDQGYMDIKHPELGGLTYRQAGKVNPAALAATKGETPIQEIQRKIAEGTLANQPSSFETNRARAESATALSDEELKLLRSGKTRSGGIPGGKGGAGKTLSAKDKMAVEAYKVQHPGSTDLDAIAAMTYNKPILPRSTQAWIGPGGQLYLNADEAPAGSILALTDPKTGAIVNMPGGGALDPASLPAGKLQEHARTIMALTDVKKLTDAMAVLTPEEEALRPFIQQRLRALGK